MKLRLYSDLHLEFLPVTWLAFIDRLPRDCDVLVLAGDISSTHIHSVLSAFADRYPFVVYVPGNHDYWRLDRGKHTWAVRRAMGRHHNLVWLENDILERDGFRILGTTLWFPKTGLSEARRGSSGMQWSDYAKIRGFSRWGYDAHTRAVRFLRGELREGDLVVTHHLPSWRSIHPNRAADPDNCFYVADLEELIVERRPRLWMHGHTHESTRYEIGPTTVLCNPFGYPDHDENPRFDPSLLFELEQPYG